VGLQTVVDPEPRPDLHSRSCQHSRHGYEACPEIRPAPLGVPADPVRGRDLGDRPVRVPVNPSSAHPGNGLARSGRPRCDQVVGVLGGPGSGGMARRPGWLRRWLRCANDRSCSPMVVVDLGCCAVESVIRRPTLPLRRWFGPNRGRRRPAPRRHRPPVSDQGRFQLMRSSLS
jgi:hypothetical protein